MKDLLKIFVFALVIIFGFAGYTRYGLPLIIPEAPPVEEKLSGDITMEQYIGIGDKIFNGKGTCTLCHSPVGGRAPLLDTIGSLALERLKDERYKGKATTGEEYILESLVDTSAFVVAGFGKTGTNDTVSPMPNVDKGAIGLSDVEMGAVIAYLQSIAGVEVTVALPSGDSSAMPEEEAPATIKLAESAAEAFIKFECTMCHIGPEIEEGGDMGPDLGGFAATAGSRKEGVSARAFVLESIMNPNAVIAEGFDADTMPDDYPARMTFAEFNLIADAILGVKNQ